MKIDNSTIFFGIIVITKILYENCFPTGCKRGCCQVNRRRALLPNSDPLRRLRKQVRHHPRKQVEGLCAEVGAQLLSDFEGTSLDTLREMVGMGMGLSFLPGLYVRSSLGQELSITATELQGAPIYRTIGLVWRKSSARAEEFRTLADHFRNTVRREFPEFTIV